MRLKLTRVLKGKPGMPGFLVYGRYELFGFIERSVSLIKKSVEETLNKPSVRGDNQRLSTGLSTR